MRADTSINLHSGRASCARPPKKTLHFSAKWREIEMSCVQEPPGDVSAARAKTQKHKLSSGGVGLRNERSACDFNTLVFTITAQGPVMNQTATRQSPLRRTQRGRPGRRQDFKSLAVERVARKSKGTQKLGDVLIGGRKLFVTLKIPTHPEQCC